MVLESLKVRLIVTTTLQVILDTVQVGSLCPNANCHLTGGFFFAPGRHMVNNHALLGHVFKTLQSQSQSNASENVGVIVAASLSTISRM